jgi:hypothetical protein
MSARIRRGLTFSNVCSFLALVIALGAGTAYAANTVRSSDIVDGQVMNADIGTNAVSTVKIGNGAVTSNDIRTDAVGSAEIAAGAVGASEVANDSLTLSDIAGAATNGSVSLSGIPNGRCNQVTFNVASAVVGDTAIVSTGAAMQNGILMYANRVASAGHVEVNACNFSGTTMMAITSLPVRIITFR